MLTGTNVEVPPAAPEDSKKKKKKADTTDIDALLAEIEGPAGAPTEPLLKSGQPLAVQRLVILTTVHSVSLLVAKHVCVRFCVEGGMFDVFFFSKKEVKYRYTEHYNSSFYSCCCCCRYHYHCHYNCKCWCCCWDD